jgi:prepilin peptidase CpaA
MSIAAIAIIAAGIALIAAALWDLTKFEIPDTITVIILGAAVAYGLATPGFNWMSHIGAMVLFFGVGLFLFSRGWLGGGDVKVMTACAAWAGLSGLLMQLALISVAGGALVGALMLGRTIVRLSGRDPVQTLHLFRADARVPYAVAIAGGVAWWGALTFA